MWISGRGCGLGVVGGPGLGGGAVAEGGVQPPGVVPVDPLSGGQLYLLDGPPRLAWFDQLGLVEAVDGFGQRVVIGAADGTC